MRLVWRSRWVSLVVALLGWSTAEAAGVETVKVPMSDGVSLMTDIYRPANPERLPTILVRTTYGRRGLAGQAALAAARGYAVVCQDVRGRGESGGTPVPIFRDSGWTADYPYRDGHDTIRWIAKQPWCSGAIGTWGGSALGIVQNMQAPGAPAELKAQWVLVASYDLYREGIFQGGAWRSELIGAWLRSQGLDQGNRALFRKNASILSFWKNYQPADVADQVNAPAVFLGGWYDIFAQGTIDAFTTLQEKGGPGAKGRCRLVMAPLAHGTFDSLRYPKPAFPAIGDAFRFFDHHLKGMANGVEEEKPVAYYVMGDPTNPKAPGNCWRYADRWPPPAKVTDFFFHADGRLSRNNPPTGQDQRSYTYDPEKPVPTLGGQNLTIVKGPADLRPWESRADVLTFSTDPLDQPLEVTGRVKARIYVSSDAPDTDFSVALADVYPDGRAMLVCDGLLRARYREGQDREVPLSPGTVVPLEVDLWSTSLVFAAGHQIRVYVSSSNSPRYEPNPNTGLSLDDPQPPRPATNTVHLGGRYPSRVWLPILGEGESAGQP